jgi:hypothetical protein
MMWYGNKNQFLISKQFESIGNYFQKICCIYCQQSFGLPNNTCDDTQELYRKTCTFFLRIIRCLKYCIYKHMDICGWGKCYKDPIWYIFSK